MQKQGEKLRKISLRRAGFDNNLKTEVELYKYRETFLKLDLAVEVEHSLFQVLSLPLAMLSLYVLACASGLRGFKTLEVVFEDAVCDREAIIARPANRERCGQASVTLACVQVDVRLLAVDSDNFCGFGLPVLPVVFADVGDRCAFEVWVAVWVGHGCSVVERQVSVPEKAVDAREDLAGASANLDVDTARGSAMLRSLATLQDAAVSAGCDPEACRCWLVVGLLTENVDSVMTC